MAYNCCECDCLFYATQQNIKRWLPRSIFLLLVLAAATVGILRYGPAPHIVVNIEDARLDTFEFASTQCSATTPPCFSYNISVALAMHNPNIAMTIKHTKKLMVSFIFHYRRLHNLTVVSAGYRQRPHKKELHYIQATGEVPSLLLGDEAAQDFKKQNATGRFRVEVHFSGQITYQRIAIAMKPDLRLSCPLELQLAPPGHEVIVFYEVNCLPVKPQNIDF